MAEEEPHMRAAEELVAQMCRGGCDGAGGERTRRDALDEWEEAEAGEEEWEEEEEEEEERGGGRW